MSELEKRMYEKVGINNEMLYPPFPQRNLLIEVTNKCNSNCIFCANSKMKRKRGFISPKLVYDILEEAYKLGTREVGFYTTGESLLDRNLELYVEEAKKVGYNYVYITTNGILLNENRIESLVKAGIDSFKLSINAVNEEEYEFIHGISYFKNVINNLKKLYNYREKNCLKYKIYVSYIATKFTDHDEKKIKNTFNKFCDDVVIVNVRNQSGMMPENDELLKCEKKGNKIPASRHLPCHYVFDAINITYEGYLTACCTDFENYLVYADLNKETLRKAWHNKTITELRRKHLSKSIDDTLCYNCIYNTKKVPNPLTENYCTKIDEKNFNSNDTIERINNYINKHY